VRVQEGGRKKIRRGDHSGTIEQVNADLLETLLAGGYTPVATVPMAGKDGDQWLPVNADADRAAAAIAGALGAALVVLTDVAGVYADPEDETTRIDEVATADDWSDLEAAAEGFMTKKVMAAEEALDGGAASVAVANANAEAPVTSALDGDATTILPGALETADADAEVSAQ
jgi:acetylglutamate/LysW-gamma-L-alpha-aminoadipate kinase